MTRSAAQLLATLAATALLAGCATMGDSAAWITLIDGDKGLDNFTRLGDANWTATDGAVQATQGGKDAAYLVSKQSYSNFVIRVESGPIPVTVVLDSTATKGTKSTTMRAVVQISDTGTEKAINSWRVLD